MKSKTGNISVLVLFHLLVFTAPFTAKAMHHDEKPALVLSGISASGEENCLICSFNYYSFKHTTGTSITTICQMIREVVPVNNSEVFMSCLMYIKLRAPPQLQLF
jgi:hypothetical protein